MTDHSQSNAAELDEPIQPENPLHPTLLDPTEEAAVAEAEFHARRRERQVEDFMALRAARNKTESTVSEAQLAANKANAQLSSGPTSESGKAISSRNNFRHGLTQTEGDLVLLESESKDEYNRALADFLAEWQPTTPTERDLVERLASRQWLRRRAMKLQKYYLSVVDGQIMDLPNFGLYRRYEALHERAYNKALADLIRLRGLRLREQNGFESQRRKNEEHVYRIRTLKNREKLQELAIRTAEARAALQERKLLLAESCPNPKMADKSHESSQ